MNVKSLIQFFNSRSTSPVSKPPVAIRQPVFNLNGKVKNLAREFSKPAQSLSNPRPPRSFGQVKKAARTIHSEPIPDQLQNGRGTAGNGVSQGPGRCGQVSKEGDSTGYVTSVQHTAPPKQSDPEGQLSQQYQEAAEVAVELVQDISQTTSRPTGPEQASDWKRVESARGVTPNSITSHFEISRIKKWSRRMPATPIRLDDMLSRVDSPVAVSQEWNRPDPIDSVVMSARNSELRKTKSMGSSVGRYESILSLGLGTVEEQLVPRAPNKSTEPPPLKIVKVRKSEPVNDLGFNTFGCYGESTLAPPKVPFLAPPAQRFIEPQELAQSLQAPSISDSVSIPGRPISHRQPSEVLSVVLVPPVKRTAKTQAGSQTLVMPSFSRLPGKRAYQTLSHHGVPQMKIYDDTEWMNRRYQALQKNMDQTDGNAHAPVGTLDGFSISPTSWSTQTSPEDPPSVAETTSFMHTPLSPARAPFRDYIMSPDDTAGKYHSLPKRKVELIRPLPDPFFAEQIALQQFNPRFSTFTKQESFSDASFITIDQEAPSGGPDIGPKPRKLGPAYKSLIQRIIAREEATSRAAGLMSPSYVVAGLLSRALSRVNSVDMENRGYSSRRRQ